MLVHICCSVDSHYFLSELQKIYSNEKMIGFFYNPNIHPRSEYDLRLLDVKRSCEMLGVELIEGKYDDEVWSDEVRGLEDEPEKGARCSACFDVRLVESAKLATKLGEKIFTTTLLSSPMKTQDILFSQGDKIAKDFGLEFVKIDVRSKGGTQRQNDLSKKDNLYRQNYCGCKFALQKQREKQGRFPLEFISPISKQIMPGSIEHRNTVFEYRNALEKQNKPYILRQQSQIIWRCLSAKLESEGNIVPSYILAHSSEKKSVRLGRLLWIERLDIGLVGYSRRDDSVFLTLESLNSLLNSEYQSVKQLNQDPPSYQTELEIRAKILLPQGLSPIVIVDHDIQSDLRIEIRSIFQEEKVFEIIEEI